MPFPSIFFPMPVSLVCCCVLLWRTPFGLTYIPSSFLTTFCLHIYVCCVLVFPYYLHYPMPQGLGTPCPDLTTVPPFPPFLPHPQAALYLPLPPAFAFWFLYPAHVFTTDLHLTSCLLLYTPFPFPQPSPCLCCPGPVCLALVTFRLAFTSDSCLPGNRLTFLPPFYLLLFSVYPAFLVPTTIMDGEFSPTSVLFAFGFKFAWFSLMCWWGLFIIPFLARFSRRLLLLPMLAVHLFFLPTLDSPCPLYMPVVVEFITLPPPFPPTQNVVCLLPPPPTRDPAPPTPFPAVPRPPVPPPHLPLVPHGQPCLPSYLLPFTFAPLPATALPPYVLFLPYTPHLPYLEEDLLPCALKLVGALYACQ